LRTLPQAFTAAASFKHVHLYPGISFSGTAAASTASAALAAAFAAFFAAAAVSSTSASVGAGESTSCFSSFSDSDVCVGVLAAVYVKIDEISTSLCNTLEHNATHGLQL